MLERSRHGAGTAAIAALLVAGLAFMAGAGLAWHHPVAPGPALIAFVLACAAVAWRPGIWLYVVPAALPLLELCAVDRLGGVRGVRPAAARRGCRRPCPLGACEVGDARRAGSAFVRHDGLRRAGRRVRCVQRGGPGQRHLGGRRGLQRVVPGLRRPVEQLAHLQEPAVRRAAVAAAAARNPRRIGLGGAPPGLGHAGGAGHRRAGRRLGAHGLHRSVGLFRPLSHDRAVLGDACRGCGDRCLPGAGHALRRLGAVDVAHAAALGRGGCAGSADGLRVPHDLLARRLPRRGRLAGIAGPAAGQAAGRWRRACLGAARTEDHRAAARHGHLPGAGVRCLGLRWRRRGAGGDRAGACRAEAAAGAAPLAPGGQPGTGTCARARGGRRARAGNLHARSLRGDRARPRAPDRALAERRRPHARRGRLAAGHRSGSPACRLCAGRAWRGVSRRRAVRAIGRRRTDQVRSSCSGPRRRRTRAACWR